MNDASSHVASFNLSFVKKVYLTVGTWFERPPHGSEIVISQDRWSLISGQPTLKHETVPD